MSLLGFKTEGLSSFKVAFKSTPFAIKFARCELSWLLSISIRVPGLFGLCSSSVGISTPLVTQLFVSAGLEYNAGPPWLAFISFTIFLVLSTSPFLTTCLQLEFTTDELVCDALRTIRGPNKVLTCEACSLTSWESMVLSFFFSISDRFHSGIDVLRNFSCSSFCRWSCSFLFFFSISSTFHAGKTVVISKDFSLVMDNLFVWIFSDRRLTIHDMTKLLLTWQGFFHHCESFRKL